MESPSPDVPSEALLLEHAEFLAGLAAQLVQDANDAQDIIQETMISAMRHPPREDATVRGWITRVAKNHSLQLFRARRRRNAREELAARAELVPSTSEIVERENARRAVVDTLVELKEPYRSAILLRFYEDLPPREVARRLGVPVETARTRIKRGLALLRDALDQRYASDRGRWLSALMPLAIPRLAPPASHPPPQSVTSEIGPMTRSLASIALVTLFTVAYVAWPRWATWLNEARSGDSASYEATTVDTWSQIGAAVAMRSSVATEVGCQIEVRLVLASSGQPAAGVRVIAEADGDELAIAVSDAHGLVTLNVPRREAWTVRARATETTLAAENEVLDDSVHSLFNVTIPLAQAVRVAGVTVDDRGNVVPYAEILAYSSMRPEIVDGDPGSIFASTRSDGDGRFSIGGLPLRFYLHAQAKNTVAVAGFVAQFDEARNVDDLEFVMSPGWALRGRVLDHTGHPVADARVDAVTVDRRGPGRSAGARDQSWRSLVCLVTTTESDGTFELRDVPARTHRLRASMEGVGSVQVNASDPSGEFDLVLEHGVEVELTVLDDAGRPVPKAMIQCAGVDVLSPQGATNDEGLARLRLRDERARIGFLVRAEGYASTLHDVVLEGRSPVRTQITLHPSRALTGHVREADGTPLRAARVVIRGEPPSASPDSAFAKMLGPLLELDSAKTDATGRFEFSHAPTGALELHAIGDGELIARAQTVVTSAESSVELTMDPMPTERLTFRGVVVDALTNVGVESFSISARPARERERSRTGVFTSATDGHFTLGGDAVGSWSLTVLADGYAPSFLRPRFFDEGVHDLRIELYPARSLAVRIVDRNGAPVPRARILCEDRRGRPITAAVSPTYWTNIVPLGARGEVELQGLPASEVYLRVRLADTDVERRFDFDLRQPIEDEQVLALDLDLLAPRREVELRLVQRLATRGGDLPIVGEWSVDVRDARGDLYASFTGHSVLDGVSRIERQLRCWVQRYAPNGTLVAHSLQTLDGDALSREHGPVLVDGPGVRVKVRLPMGACRITALCAGFEPAEAELAAGRNNSFDVVVLRFEPSTK